MPARRPGADAARARRPPAVAQPARRFSIHSRLRTAESMGLRSSGSSSHEYQPAYLTSRSAAMQPGHVRAALAEEAGLVLPRRLHVLDVHVPDEGRAGLDGRRARDSLGPEPAGVDADAEPLVAPADLREDLRGALLRVVLDVEADSVLAAEGGRLLRGVVAQAAVDVRDAEPLADAQRLRAQAAGVGDGRQAVVVEDPLPEPRLRLVERLGGGVGLPDLDRLEARGGDLLADGPPGRLVGGGDRLLVLVHPVAQLVAVAAHPGHEVGREEGRVLPRRRSAREEPARRRERRRLPRRSRRETRDG